MVFSSFIFLFYFLPIVFGAYLFCPRPLKNLLLIGASLFFYSWGEPRFIGTLLLLCAIDFVLALLIERSSPRGARAPLTLSLIINVGALGYFKYANFFMGEVSRVSGWLGHAPVEWQKVILPIGISFFTFHKISYVVDVYRRIRPASRNPIDFLLYILFFPQLIAGPIVRYHEIEDQLRSRPFSLDDIYQGLSLFCIGLAKKVLVADVVGHTADQIFALKANALSPELAWLGVIAYTAQISAELRPPIPRDKLHRFLAAVAHVVRAVDARVSVLSARWCAGRCRSAVFQPLGSLPLLRTVARRSVDLRPLGGVAWDLHDP
jgi:alginate O-acetyltransferase complex protein AlgI